MDVRCTLAAIALMLLVSAAHPMRASPDADTECEQTEYAAYRDCVHAAARHKRQLSASSVIINGTTPVVVVATLNSTEPVIEVNCRRLNFDCLIGCRNVTSCERLCPVCPLEADQLNADYRTVVLETADGNQERFKARIEAGRNITTIIRLTNVLNTTNHIHIPTNVTTNNVNNVNVHSNLTDTTGGDFGLGRSPDGLSSCCYVLRQSNCRATSAGARCHNRRQRKCDDRICKARVMHAKVRKICPRSGGGGECKQRVVYVPEPGAHKCVRTERWPYVVCGTVVARNSDAYHDQERAYRQGPPPSAWAPAPYYYRPPWMDCRYTGGCYGEEYASGGGRGHHRRRPHGSDGDVYYEDEVAGDLDQEAVNGGDIGQSGEEVLEDEKCKVVSNNGTTVEITNCTSNSLNDNDYAKEPKVNFDNDANEVNEDSRFKRHSSGNSIEDGGGRRRQQQHRRQHLDHNYVDDDDDERYEHQLPLSRIAEDFEYDEELDHPYKRQNSRKNRRHGGGRRRNGKKHQKHRKIVYEDDEEVV